MRRALLCLSLLGALGAASGQAARPRGEDAGRFQAARATVEAFYRSLPTIDPAHRDPTGVEGPLCGTLRGNAPWVELMLISDLRDESRTDWLKAKALFGLSCIYTGGEARCLGSLAEELIALDADPGGLSPSLRYAVTAWLERLTQGMSVPRAAASGRYHRRDYGRWWTEEGRWLFPGTCGDAKI